MKKILSIMLVTVLLLFTLTACSSSSQDTGETQNTAATTTMDAVATEEVADTEAAGTEVTGTEAADMDEELTEDVSANAEITAAAMEAETTLTQAEESTADSELTQTQEKTEGGNSSMLVVYFSLAGEQYSVGEIEEGNTAIIANMIAEETGADVFAIEAQEAYPSSYEEKLDIARQEQSSGARPAYVGDVENWEDYDTIFLGYPIWWGEIPNIVYTFMENHDFSGKTVLPFCTHGGSGLSGSQQDVANTTEATVLDGLAIAGTTAQNDRERALEQVRSWLESSGLS